MNSLLWVPAFPGRAAVLAIALLFAYGKSQDPIIGKYRLLDPRGTDKDSEWILEITGDEYNTALVRKFKGQTDSTIERHALKRIGGNIYSIEWMGTTERVHSSTVNKSRILARTKEMCKEMRLSGDTLKVRNHDIYTGHSKTLSGEWVHQYRYAWDEGKRVTGESTSLFFSKDSLRIIISSHQDTSNYAVKISNDTLSALKQGGDKAAGLKWNYSISGDTLHLGLISPPQLFVRYGK